MARSRPSFHNVIAKALAFALIFLIIIAQIVEFLGVHILAICHLCGRQEALTAPFEQPEASEHPQLDPENSDSSKANGFESTMVHDSSPTSFTFPTTIDMIKPMTSHFKGDEVLFQTHTADEYEQESRAAPIIHVITSSEIRSGATKCQTEAQFLHKEFTVDEYNDEDENEGKEEEEETGKDTAPGIDDIDDSEDEDDFADVKEAVNLEAIKQIAMIYRAKDMEAASTEILDAGHQLSCEIDPEPLNGSYNLIYILRWSDGTRWVVRIPGHGCQFEMLDAARMESEYGTMELIRKNTTVPVPQVYYYTWMPDRAGVPFALLSFVEGDTLFRYWNSPSTTKEQKLNTLTSIANYMSTLSKLKFPKTGMLYFDRYDSEPRVGPIIGNVREDLENIWGSPFLKPQRDSFKDALYQEVKSVERLDTGADCILQILQLAIGSIPEYLATQNEYSLVPPDLDWQNIMMNDQGEVTAFIDWDCVAITTISSGAGKYPLWLTRDWQSIKHDSEAGVHQVDNDEQDTIIWREDSSAELSLYRQHYLKAMTLSQGPDYDPRWTKLSHILETVSVAVSEGHSGECRMDKLLQHAGVSFSWVAYAEAYDRVDTAEMDGVIREAFHNMWHAEWEER